MDDGLSDLTTIKEKEVRFGKKPDARTAAILGKHSHTSGQPEKAVDYFKSAVKFNKDKSIDYSRDLFQAYYNGYRYSKKYSVEDLQKSAEMVLASKTADPETRWRTCNDMGRLVNKVEDQKLILPYIEKAYKLVTNHKDELPGWAVFNANLNYAIYIEKDIDKAVDMKKKDMPEAWMENPRDLNSFTWWCFENNINLKEARKLAKKGADLSNPGSEKAGILDTLAEIVNALGDPKEAAKISEEALKENPDSDFYKKQVERFKKLAGS